MLRTAITESIRLEVHRAGPSQGPMGACRGRVDRKKKKYFHAPTLYRQSESYFIIQSGKVAAKSNLSFLKGFYTIYLFSFSAPVPGLPLTSEDVVVDLFGVISITLLTGTFFVSTAPFASAVALALLLTIALWASLIIFSCFSTA